MTVDFSQDPGAPSKQPAHVYRRPVVPIIFPTEEEVPETNRHLELRTALYLTLKDELATTATIGSEQFVYYDPTNPKRCLAPDLFVKLGAPHALFDSWKVWKRGAPDVAVEVVSAFDRRDDDWDDKLERYRAAGIGEVVRFDADDKEAPIRVWDHVDGDLVERAADDPRRRECMALRLWWTVVPSEELGPTLRLARHPAGRDLLATPSEARIAAEQLALREAAARVAADQAREASEQAREVSEQAREASEQAREASEQAREVSEQARIAAERERDALAEEVAALRAELAKRGSDTM